MNGMYVVGNAKNATAEADACVCANITFELRGVIMAVKLKVETTRAYRWVHVSQSFLAGNANVTHTRRVVRETSSGR